MFLGLNTLAAAIGKVFEKRERSRAAVADRTIGGRKRDMASDLANKVVSCKAVIDSYSMDIASLTSIAAYCCLLLNTSIWSSH